ncbi:MAG: rhomboid family intramembrane serine protease [Saprospiraceae bacterium]|nr:rhomboid family intramembrane serine protease [Candidatus Opimibacter skivensis]MBL0008216.1 rhomboid family intramembrane serine protease [Candidatus Opimibacter skivensis]MBP8085687.1 rhomboid family intramembrane serine protease [Saprospiraceae bacterium]
MKLKFNSPVILGFSLICVAVFVLDKVMVGTLMPYFTLGNVNTSSALSLLTLFTHVIGHASIEHLMGNLTFILLLGPIVEEKYGDSRTLFMMLITALVTGILNLLFFHTGLMGASGIVFMLILLVSFTNTKSGEIPVTFILVALLFIGKEVIESLNTDQISQFAHIIGGVCGSVFGFVTRPGKG